MWIQDDVPIYPLRTDFATGCDSMTRAPQAFFKERQPAAVLKHGILGRYLQPFASKTGMTAPGRRVVYLDGYAGPGTYDDGTPGSPALAEQTAKKIAGSRELQGIYVEKDPEMYEQLCEMLDGFDNWIAYNDSIARCLSDVMTEVGKAPLFAFMDPFGLPIAFADLVAHLLTRPRSQKTEVLINFSVPGLKRNAGQLVSKKMYPAKASVIKGVNDRLGGDWWQDIWRDSDEDEREELVLEGYVKRLAAAGTGRWGWWTIPVSRRPEGEPIYHLVFLTRHHDGLWQFNQALSGALEEYHDFCYQGQLDLDPIEEREKRWVAEIESNITTLLESGPFILGQKLDVVCGDVLGYAREKHFKRAVKNLHAKGVTPTTGVGKMQRMRIEPS